jgi:copper chaperone CopZ
MNLTKAKKMYSTFEISKSQCMTCNNEVLKQLGTLRGVFGAEIETIDGRITVNHTDEITRADIATKLDELGWIIADGQTEVPAYDPPSEWGCAL